MTLRLERDGPVAHLLIDRAEKRNAFNQAMWDAFPKLLDEVKADSGIRVLVLRAASSGGAFCAGADIGEFATGARDPEWRARNQASIAKVQRELDGGRQNGWYLGPPRLTMRDRRCSHP